MDYLECKKSPGAGDITTEFVKSCKSEVANGLIIFNYIIVKKIPERWTEGIRSVVQNGGPQLSVSNFRESPYCHLWQRHSKS